MPIVTIFALPFGLLMGILLVLGRLSANREITGMRVAGLSITQITAPVILIALIGVAASLFINFYYSPMSRTEKEIKKHDLVHDPTKVIQPLKFNKGLPGVVIYVAERKENYVADVLLWVFDEKKRVTHFVRAEHGTFEYIPEEDVLIFNCFNGTVELRDETDPENYFGTALLTVSYKDLPLRILLGEDKKGVHRKLSMLTLGELLDFRKEAIHKSERGDPEGANERFHAQMQIQENFAKSFSVLSLALIAIPLGIKISRSETMANLGIALVLGLSYYFFMVLIGMLKGHPEWRPDFLIWLPNILFQALGIYMLRRLSVR